MYGNYTIALCDILGFSRLMQNAPLESVIDHGLGWFRKALFHGAHQEDFPEDPPTLDELNDQGKLGVAWFSDTVILYTEEDTEECLQALMTAVGFLAFETIVTARTMIRCGIAHGPAYMDQENSLYVGEPIIDAYRLEQRQQWAGGCLAQSAVDRLPTAVQSGRFADWWLTPYEVPLKGNSSHHTLAVWWPLGFHPPDWELRWSKERTDPTSEEIEREPSIYEKFCNTRVFHARSCPTCTSNSSPS